MRFRITRDYLTPNGLPHSRHGLTFRSSDHDGSLELPVTVKLYDDDGQLYYEARCTCHEAAEQAHDWAMADAGCTNSMIRMADGEPFTPFIG